MTLTLSDVNVGAGETSGDYQRHACRSPCIRTTGQAYGDNAAIWPTLRREESGSQFDSFGEPAGKWRNLHRNSACTTVRLYQRPSVLTRWRFPSPSELIPWRGE